MTRPTQNELIWKMLEEAGPAGCTTADVAGRATEEGIYINRYSARIMELDPDKTLIHREKIPGSSQWRYTLTRHLSLSGRVTPSTERRVDSSAGQREVGLPISRPESDTTSDSLFDLAPVSGTKTRSAITGERL